MRAALAAALAAALSSGAAAAEPVAFPAAYPVAFPAAYPEGPVWDGEVLRYAEMRADRVMRWSEAEGLSVFWEAPGCGPTALAPYGDGWIVACHLGGRLARLDADGREIGAFDATEDGIAVGNPNDVAADGRGGVYASDSGVFAAYADPTGAVLHLSADGVLRRVAEGLRYANGVFADGDRLLVSEHLARRVLAFPVAADGGLGPPSVAMDLAGLPSPTAPPYAETGPDGLERAPDGALWVAEYGAARLIAGTETVAVPQRFVTSLAFSADGRLAVTGSRGNARPPFPGCVFVTTVEALRAGFDRPPAPCVE